MNKDTEDRFGFGENWQQFLDKFSGERVEAAQKILLGRLMRDNLNGMSFLDIGSGSGLHSLAAFRAGAERIVSFDYDGNSVAATKTLKRYAGNPENWTVMQGSVLDEAFVRSLGDFDIVYSWGVLHHTGDMWSAIRNARIPVADNGTFFIALYSDTAYRNSSLDGRPTPEQWLDIKQTYNASSPLKKKFMEYQFVWDTFFANAFPHPVRLLRGCNALRRYIKNIGRGMDLWVDIRDWLGGWPMEFVKEAECVDFCAEQLGLECVDMHTEVANTEFLFRPQKASNYWDDIIAKRQIFKLNSPFTHVEGHMWKVSIPELVEYSILSSPAGEWGRSPLLFAENGRITGYANAMHKGIIQFGEGRFSHWNEDLLFSTPDNSNPNSNGKEYSLILP